MGQLENHTVTDFREQVMRYEELVLERRQGLISQGLISQVQTFSMSHNTGLWWFKTQKEDKPLSVCESCRGRVIMFTRGQTRTDRQGVCGRAENKQANLINRSHKWYDKDSLSHTQTHAYTHMHTCVFIRTEQMELLIGSKMLAWRETVDVYIFF